MKDDPKRIFEQILGDGGILFIDKISRLRRTLYDSKVKKWLKRKSAV